MHIVTDTHPNVLLYPLDISIATLAPITIDIHDAILVGTTIHLAAENGEFLRVHHTLHFLNYQITQ